MSAKLKLLAIILPLAMTAGWAGRAFAQASSIGFGVALCSKYIADLKDPRMPSDHYFDYTQGYMSALNLMAYHNKYRATDLLSNDFGTDAQEAFILSWCHQNPGRNYETATVTLYTLMRERQGLPKFLPDVRPSSPSEMSRQ
jgi:hypothetical protein